MVGSHCFCRSGISFKVAFMLRALNQPREPGFVGFMDRSGRRVPACGLTHCERTPHG